MYSSLVFLFLLYSATAQISTRPLQNGVNQTILPCETLYYTFNVAPTSPQFYLTVTLTSEDPVTLTVIDQPPQVNGSLLCLSGYTSKCTTVFPSPNCTIRAQCALKTGPWYAIVEHAGALSKSVFSLNFNTAGFKARRTLPVNDQMSDPFRAVGNVFGPDWTCETCDPNDIYDYFTLTLPTVDVVGSRIVVNVRHNDNDTQPLYTYLSNTNDAGCLGPRGGTQTQISPCAFNQTQGQSWLLTIERTESSQNYSVKAYVDRPNVVSITGGIENTQTGRLLNPLDSIYFQFPFPTDVSTSDSLVMISVLDNVDNGVLQLSQDYGFLPGQGCGSTYKSCTSNIGCILRYDPCEIQGRTTGFWYIGVQALSFSKPNLPITFTIAVTINPLNPVSVQYNQPVLQRSKIGITDQFILPPPPADSWVGIDVYFDASETTQVINNTLAVLYLNNAPLAGGFGCYSYRRTCRLQRTNTDIYSCSLQLDPCELSQYPNGITFSIWATHAAGFYWHQQMALFTIEPYYFSPFDSDRSLSSGAVITDVVAAGQFQLYRVNSVSGRFQLKVAHEAQTPVPIIKRQANPTPAINVLIFSNSQNLGPTCPCWEPDYQATLAPNTFLNYTLDYCRTMSFNSGLIIAIQGVPFSPTSPSLLLYNEIPFVLSLTITSQSDPTVVRDLSPGVSNIVYDDALFPKYYTLQFPRQNLLSKAIIVKARGHTDAGIQIKLVPFNISDPVLGCQTLTVPTSNLCTISPDNDGFCTITKKGCAFSSDTDQTTFIVEVRSTISNTLTYAPFNLYFELIEQSPQSLSSGVPVSGHLQRDIYAHFYIDVPSDKAGKSTLTVEVYVDAGLQVAKNAGLLVFMNDPNTPSPAGNTDCLCYTKQFSQTFTKVLVIVSPCDLLPGRYHFGLTTSALVYDVFPVKYTLWATFSDPLITTTSTSGVQFDVPYDMSLFVGQSAIIAFSVPDSFITLGNPPDTAKEITIKISTTRAQDRVSGSLSHDSPLNCGCYIPDTQCSPNTTECSIPLRYCTSSAGTKYLEVAVTNALDSLNPVPFTVLISRATPLTTVLQLTVATGCTPASRNSVTLDGLVANQYYQHYKLSYQGTPVGDENVQFYFTNVTGGSALVNFARGNLATQYCRSNSGVNLCPPDPEGECPTIFSSCTTDSDYLSVFASSNNNNDPVSYRVSACRTTITSFPATGVNAATLAPGDSVTYRVSFANTNPANTPLIVISLSPEVIPGDSFGISITFRQSTCKSCPSVVGFEVHQTCTSADTVCRLLVPFCQLPLNFQSTDFLIILTSNILTDQGYSLKLTQSAPASTTSLTIGTKQTISVPANDGWALVSWTVQQSDIISPNTGIQNGFIGFTSKDEGGAYIETHFSTDRSTVMCPGTILTPVSPGIDILNKKPIGSGCCNPTDTYYMAFYNPHTAATSFDIVAILDKEASFTTLPWGAARQATVGTLTAPAYVASNREPYSLNPLLSDVVISYPGIPANSNGWSILQVQKTSLGENITEVFMEFNRVAGPETQSSCYSQSLFPGKGTPSSNFSAPFILQTFGCTAKPTDIWIGARTYDNTAQTFSVSVANYYPKALQFGTSNIVTAVASTSIATNFFVDITSTMIGSRLNLHLIVGSINGTVQITSRKNYLAGTGNTCLGNTGGFTGTASEGNPYDFILPSCSVNTGRLFIGFRPTSLADDSVPAVVLNITIFSESSLTNGSTTLSLNTPISYNSFPEPIQYTFNSGAQSAFSKITYFRALFQGVTTTLSKSPSFTWYRAGYCSSPFNTMYCNPSEGVEADADTNCASIIFPCNSLPGTTYELTLHDLVNYSDVWSINMQKFNVDPIVITALGDYQVQLNAHELQFLQLSLTSSFLFPGQNIKISVSSVSCGSVEVYLVEDYVPGPNCHSNATCTNFTNSCDLYTLNTCDIMTRDSVGDYFITVRGLRQFTKTIPIKVTISVTGPESVTFRTLHVNEKHTLYAHPLTDISPNTCPDIQHNILVPPTCCLPAPSFTSQFWQPDPTIWVYPIDGAHFSENSNVISISLQTDRVVSATVVLSAERPSILCAVGPTPKQPSFFQSCTANALTGFVCSFTLDPCTIQNTRQVYIHVTSVQYASNSVSLPINNPLNYLTTNGPINGALAIPLLYITNSHTPFTVVDVHPSTDTQYLRFELARNERQFIRIVHDPNRATSLDYYVRANLVRVQGGTVRLFNSWAYTCASDPRCSQTTCKTVTLTNACTTTSLARCSACATSTYQSCDTNINRNGNSFLQIVPSAVSTAGTNVWGVIQFDFYVTRVPIQNDICESVLDNTHKYYKHELAPNAQQIFQFDLRQQSSAGYVQLNVADDILPVNGECSTTTNPFSETCVSNSRNLCQVFYRKYGIPQVSVFGVASSGGLSEFYQFSGKLVDVPVHTLTNAVSWYTPTSSVNSTSLCVEKNFTEYYLFVASSTPNAILVEFQPKSASTVYMNREHVTYKWGTHGCTANANGYCSFLVACPQSSGNLAGNYYFHVPATEHTITVSGLTIEPVPLTIGGDAATHVFDSAGDYVVFEISNAAGNQVDPTNDLYIVYDSIPGVNTWVTRGSLGDTACAIAVNDIPSGISIPACQVNATKDKFYVYFFISDLSTCIASTLSVKAYFYIDNSSQVTYVDPAANFTVSAGQIRRTKFNVGLIGDNDVVKVRTPLVSFGDVALTMWKGNYVSNSAPTCGAACSKSDPQNKLVVWGDNCWHCGGNSYDTIFVDILGERTAAQYDAAQLWVTAEKSQWIDLTSGSYVNTTLGGPVIDLAFFTAPLNHNSGNLFEIIVNEGYAVQVDIYPADCSLRAIDSPVTMWCFEDEICHVPFSIISNFGSFFPATSLTPSMWSDTKLRIVVTGQESNFLIRYLGGSGACSGISTEASSFCSSVRSGSAWGTPETFSEKDQFASQTYQLLQTRFSCAVDTGCACRTLSSTCLQYLRQFSCELSFMMCTDSGQAQYSSVTLCTNIETECGRTWTEVALSQYSCLHNFYPDGVRWVSADYEDVTVSVNQPPTSAATDLLGLWIFLGILGLFILVGIVFAFIRFVLPSFYHTPAELMSGDGSNPYVEL